MNEKERLMKAVETLGKEDIKALAEEAEAVKEGREEGKAEFDGTAKKANANRTSLDLKEMAKAAEFMKNANMPITMKDDDLEWGKGETDVRSLKPSTYRQIEFRMAVMQTNLLRDIAQSLVDLQRLMMVSLKKEGVTDIEGELNELMDELSKKYGKKA